ncbi:MAG: cyclic nucleotide-binding domain-containing protein [Spirochaetaceae bacterium]|nr:cyclic nucleotide-binding domain-containing protein [Spirochaetaceae bacterium]
MGYIGIVNSDEEIGTQIIRLLKEDNIANYKILTCEEEIIEFISFELPDLVIINFSDPNLNIESIMEQISQDIWVNNFGIIGIHDQEKITEEAVMKKYIEFNILTLLDTLLYKIVLTKCAKIILENKQLLFNKGLSEKFFDKDAGSLKIGNDPLTVSIYAGLTSSMLIQKSLVKPESRMHIQLVFSELIINAIEHGNCGITFDEKTDFLESGGNIIDLIVKKNEDPVIAAKKVSIEWEMSKDKSIFIIRDEGTGFNVFTLKDKIKKEGAYALHGRGVKMASLFAERLAYNKKGNAVLVQIRHDRDISPKAPDSLASEEVIDVKKGDIVCKEGEFGDSLYYISSGKYSVWHANKKVGELDPADIFIGEMAFFLNNERSATVVAELHGRIIKISRKNFIRIIKKYPQYGLFLVKLLSEKIVRANIANAGLQNSLTNMKLTI